MTDRVHDLGRGYTLREFHDNGELVGYTITGPAGPNCRKNGLCGGLCAIKPYSVPMSEDEMQDYHVWSVTGEWPNITLSPSVCCDCGSQHGHVQNGVWT